jgi:hypothetical protein
VDPLHRPSVTRVTRRHLLTRVFPAVAVLPAAVGGCSVFGQSAAKAPDPVPALADAARSDAALAAAAIAADPSLRARLEPLRAARATHAAELDRILGRPPATAGPGAGGTAPSPTSTSAPRSAASTSTPPSGTARRDNPGVREVHDAVAASATAASEAALVLAPEKVGLVASVAACCSTYAALL